MTASLLPLLGLALLVAGFVLRFHPMLVVAVAALATGLLAGIAPLAVVALLGRAFNDNRYVRASSLKSESRDSRWR